MPTSNKATDDSTRMRSHREKKRSIAFVFVFEARNNKSLEIDCKGKKGEKLPCPFEQNDICP